MAVDVSSDSGLMEHILSLTAPPSFVNKDGTGYSVEVKHGLKEPVSRWRSLNSQFCNCCKEGGDIICCDRCPASFHLLCLTPPIDETHLPPGRWLCNRCKRLPDLDDKLIAKITAARPDNNNPTAVAHPTIAEEKEAESMEECTVQLGSADGSKPGSETGSGRSTPSASSAAVVSKSRRNTTGDERAASVGAMVQPHPHPHPILLDSQVPLVPISMQQLRDKQHYRGASGSPAPRRALAGLAEHQRNQEKKSLMLSRNLIHLMDYLLACATFVNCRFTEILIDIFACNTTKTHSYNTHSSGSETSPLVDCDYCPCSFHMDCLDPPLAAPPKYTWLCPNHVQHALDRKLWKSLSHSARSDLWRARATNAFSEQHVKLQFMQTAKQPPRRIPHSKLVHFGPVIRRVRVPESVKSLYRAGALRPREMPSLTEKALFLSAVSHFKSSQEKKAGPKCVDSSAQTDDESMDVSVSERIVEERIPGEQKPRGENNRFLNAGTSSSVDDIMECPSDEPLLTAAVNTAVDRPLAKSDKIELRIGRPDDPVLGALMLPYCGIAIAIQEFVAPHHATITFEPISSGLGVFTWLSYAPYGCTVDGVRYGGLVPARHPDIGAGINVRCPTPDTDTGTLSEKGRRLMLSFDDDDEIDGAENGAGVCQAQSPPQCMCDVQSGANNIVGARPTTFEAGVALRHGAQLQIGCCHMVFASPLVL